jgi:hypothetical protein
MRITARAFLQLTLLMSFIAGPGIPATHASTGTLVSINPFGGTVEAPASGITLPFVTLPNETKVYVTSGDTFTGAASYNPAYFTQTGTNTGVYNFSSNSATAAPSLLFSIPLTGTAFSDQYAFGVGSYTITVKDTGTEGATLDIHADTTGGAVGKSAAYIDVMFTSTTYTGTALPTSTTISSFLTSPGMFTWDPNPPPGQPNYGISGPITEIDGVSVVPEPSSLFIVVLTIASGAISFLVRRMRRADHRGQITPSPVF